MQIEIFKSNTGKSEGYSTYIISSGLNLTGSPTKNKCSF